MKKVFLTLFLVCSFIWGNTNFADENSTSTSERSSENIKDSSVDKSDFSTSDTTTNSTKESTTTTIETAEFLSESSSSDISNIESQLNASNTKQSETPKLVKQAHVQNIGWMGSTEGDSYIGTTGKSLRLEALKLHVQSSISGGIEYSVHVQNIGWQNFVGDNQIAGTTGKSSAIEAIKIRLTGELADQYDVYYRVHSYDFGWLGWSKNGEEAGTQGYGYRAEALDVRLVKKDQPAPGVVGNGFKLKLYLTYQAHVGNVGWLHSVDNGSIAGTTGRSFRLEAIKLSLSTRDYGDIQVRSHVGKVGWQNWLSSGNVSGTTGRSLSIEAIQFRLTGRLAELFDIYYRVHVGNVGWLDWTKNGEIAGTTGISHRAEAVEIRLVKKGAATPNVGNRHYIAASNLQSSAYTVENEWLNTVSNNEIIGTVGKGLSLKGFKVSLVNNGFNGEIHYHTSTDGSNWTTSKNGQLSSENPFQMVKFNLSGEIASQYDIYYRVHVRNIGWLGWTKNGQFAGVKGENHPVEAVQLLLNMKSYPTPNSNGSVAFIDKEKKNIIYIDAGHGGKDPGAVSYGLNEKDVTLAVARKVRDKLVAKNYQVIMRRDDDSFAELVTGYPNQGIKGIASDANSTNADIFVSIHVNAGGGGSAHGIETYWYAYDSAYPSRINQRYHNDPNRLANSSRLANSVQRHIISTTKAYNRGLQRETLAVLRETRMPAILVETGFIDNRTENTKLRSGYYQDQLAQGIADGIVEYFKLKLVRR